MADALVRLKIESQEYDNKIKRAQEGLIRYADECRKCGGTLEYVEKETLEYVKSLGQMETVSKTAKGKVAELSNAYTELAVQYKQLTDAEKNSPYGQALQGSLGQLKGRITDLKGNLSDAAGEIAGPNGFGKIAESIHLPKEALGQLGQAFGSLGPVASGAMSMLPKLMSPVGAAIAAIVLAVKELIGAFKRNEDAMTAVQKIAAPFKAVWQSIQRLFDDIVRIFVDVYSHLENVAGGFSGFKAILSPVAAAIAAVRASLAIVGTVLTDIAKAVEFVSGKVQNAMQGSTVGKFFQDITDTIQGFFTKFTGWVDKIANSALGKKLGLDTLATQLKSIINTQNELTTSNQKIADSENELKKLRRENKVQNAKDEQEIARLRAEAAKKDQYNAAERIKMLEEAAALEEGIAKRNVDQKQKELDVIKLKNSLTQSGTGDLNAQADAEAEVIKATTDLYNKQRELNAQIAEAKNQMNAQKKNTTTTSKKEEPALVEGSIAAQEDEIRRLTNLWKNATEETRDGYKKQLDEAKDVLDQMLGKTVEVKTETKSLGEQAKEAFEKAKAEYLQGTGSQEMYLDAQMAMNLQSVVDKNGLQGINIPVGVEVTDEEWDTLVAQINEQLEMLGIEPIKIGVETEGTEAVVATANDTKGAWQAAASAIQAAGSAMGQIDDPAAKVAGTLAQAVASIMLGFAQASASPATGAAGVFGWIAASLSGLATAVSMVSTIKSVTQGHADGGLILPNGSAYTGDNIVARLNAGEGILTPRGVANAEMAMGQLQAAPIRTGGNLSTKIKGGDILIALDNTNRSRGGSRGVYARTR